jgi:hypothetical protein
MLYCLGLYKYTFAQRRNRLNDAFLRTYPRRYVTHDCIWSVELAGDGCSANTNCRVVRHEQALSSPQYAATHECTNCLVAGRGGGLRQWIGVLCSCNNVGIKFSVHGSVHRKYIPIYIEQDADLHSLYLETALHVSGGTSTHHQERIQLYLQHLIFVRPLLLPAAIAADNSNGLTNTRCCR